MGFLDSLGDISGVAPIVGGISSIIGLIGGSSARQQAQQQAQQALQQYGSAADQQYQNMLGNNSRTLQGAAGMGGTALTNLGSNLGAANAAAGVYNSSAVGGSLALGQQTTDTSLANLAAQQSYNANSIHNQALQSLAQMQLGQANTNYGYANNQYNQSASGFGNFLNQLGQSNLLSQGGGGQGQQYMPGVDTTQTGYTNTDLGLGAGGGGGGTGVMSGYAPGGMSQMQSMPPIGSTAAMGQQTQYNLAALGGNTGRIAMPQINGTINQGANLGGNAGGIGNGGVGAAGSNPFYQPQPQRANPWQNLNIPLGGR